MSKRNRFALDRSTRFVGLTDTIVLFKNADVTEKIEYFLGLLNSKLLDFRFKGIAKLKGGGIYEYFWNSVSKLPIRRIDFGKRTDKSKHDDVVKLVTRIIDSTSRLQSVRSDAERGSIQNIITASDRKIDAIVYELYGVSEAEQKIIEGDAVPEKSVRRKKKSISVPAKMAKSNSNPKKRLNISDLQGTLF